MPRFFVAERFVQGYIFLAKYHTETRCSTHIGGECVLISYRETVDFSASDLHELFNSVGWMSGNYPDRLEKALRNSDTVISAWDGAQLAGLVNAIDDGELTAYIHYLLVNPSFQNQRIGTELIERIKEKYRGYLYLILIAEKESLVPFYESAGLSVFKGAVPMVIITR
jgi:GNAT superfamily N-acetyltransferase